MSFPVGFRGRKIEKQFRQLPDDIQDCAEALMSELEQIGPELSGWRNFGLLKGKDKDRKVYHAHLNSGRPRYVAVWELISKDEIELLYFGTHEKADYKRL